MRRLLVDLPLRMIRADVAGVARLGLARLLQAELVAQVALLALADRCRPPPGLPTLWQVSQAKRVTSGPSMANRRCALLSGANCPRGSPGTSPAAPAVRSARCRPRRRRPAARGGSASNCATSWPWQRWHMAVRRVSQDDTCPRARRRPGSRGDLVAVAAGHLGGRHGAVAVLLDDARRRLAMAGDALVRAPGQRIGARPNRASRGGRRARTTAWAIRITPRTMITATSPAINRRAERRRPPISDSAMPCLRD